MPHTFTGKDVKRMLEPQILAPGLDDDMVVQVTELQASMSVAISLKRIADVLEDGLTAMLPNGTVLGMADIGAGIMEVMMRKS